MSKVTKVFLVDDLDGGAGDETVTFGLDGAVYEIDLSQVHAAELRSVLDKYVDVAQRIGGKPRRNSRPSLNGGSTPDTTEQRRAVREWANRNGFQVNVRGRIPAAVYEAWAASQG